jgi:nucleotide-binding universal stress UspA family protein
VVGVDGSPEAQAALRWAAFEAQVRSATLEVVVVWSVSSVVFPTRVPIPGSVELQLHKEAQDVLDHALARLEATDLAIEPKVLRGDAASVLNHRADAADLLVVGRRGVGRAREVLVGSVGHACIHNSASPVAIIPH